MPYEASIHISGRKLTITSKTLQSASYQRSGTIANPAPSELNSEPQRAMDRLLRECLTRKAPKE